MRQEGLHGCIRGGARRNTTRRDKRALPAEDLLHRDFAAAAPDKLRTAGITYVDTEEGFPIPSVRARCLLQEARRLGDGEPPLKTELVLDALEMAIWRRKPKAGLIHHSDRGVRYTGPSRSANG
jgi:putative transposase